MPHIVVIGSINLDLTAKVDRLPLAGETITDALLERCPGGKGANQALAARRLGAEVSLVGCTGSDAAADEALSLLRAAGVDLRGCCVDANTPTGLAMIAVDAAGENQIVVAPGANRCLQLNGQGLPKGDALIGQLEVPVDVLTQAAMQFSGFLCVNLAPAREVSVALLARSDLVVVNELEADWFGAQLDACTGYVALTLGARGARLMQGGQVVAEVSAPAVKAVDATGAGDTFTAALTLALVEGQPPAIALRFACTAAALATLGRGAQPSLPWRSDVEARLVDKAS